MKHFSLPQPNPKTPFVDEAAQRRATLRAELGLDELLRESEKLQGKPLENVIGNYNGRRSERRLT